MRDFHIDLASRYSMNINYWPSVMGGLFSWHSNNKGGNPCRYPRPRFPLFVSLHFILVWFIRQYADGLVELGKYFRKARVGLLHDEGGEVLFFAKRTSSSAWSCPPVPRQSASHRHHGCCRC